MSPGRSGSIVSVEPRNENFIGGKWIAPTEGKYRTDLTPATSRPLTDVAESTPADVELAFDAAHTAKAAWGEASATERAAVLNAIADAVDANKEMLAVAESWENGKPVRETLNADIPLVVDHFRYFASAIRAEEGRSTEIDKDLVAYHFREPLGVVGQIIPFNFPLLMAAWKLAPALAAGNCSVMKPASPTPSSILKLMEFLDKAIEGLVLYAFNKGEVCTCPSRALIQQDIYDEFIARCLARIDAIKQGDPLDTETVIGPQVSVQQLEKITSYVDIGRKEGAEVLIGGSRAKLAGEFAEGYFFEPTVLKGENKMRVFQEEIFGPVLAVTTFKDDADALEIANDTLYGLGAGVWTNCYHAYPAGAAFGGYKISGVGRENLALRQQCQAYRGVRIVALVTRLRRA